MPFPHPVGVLTRSSGLDLRPFRSSAQCRLPRTKGGELDMDESASRREFLRNMTALGAAGGVSVALATDSAGAQQSLAQAQPAMPASLADDTARSLPRIQLMIG